MVRTTSGKSGVGSEAENMIDLHTHVLPGLDDGASDDSVALAMCRMAVADGITTMVATPHLYGGVGVSDPNVIAGAVIRLKQLLAAEQLNLDIRFAAEMPLMEHVVDLYCSRMWPTYDASRRYVLLEMSSMRNGLAVLRDMVFRLRIAGATPILAHPERLDFLDSIEAMEALQIQGALVQITASCLFAPETKAAHRAVEWLKRGWVHVVASDAHDAVRRPPLLSPARRWLTEQMGTQQAEELTQGNAMKILQGLPI